MQLLFLSEVTMEFFGYFALVAIGIVLSLVGGGGSILSVPVLVYLFSLDIVTASSYSLFLVGTTSLLGSVLKQKQQHIDLKSGLMFSIASILATFLTRKWILPGIGEEIEIADSLIVTKRVLILSIFALVVIVSSLTILFKNSRHRADPDKTRLKFLFPVGFVTGILVGLVGAGGGFLIVPALIFFAGVPFNVAVATTLLVIGFNSLFGFLGDLMNYRINWMFLLSITALAILGMLLGNRYSSKIPTRFLCVSLAWLMLTIAVLILVTEITF
ncbi:MAG TPA: sulfite exporter TauE/SafE family protein [Chryseolinea sp.]